MPVKGAEYGTEQAEITKVLHAQENYITKLIPKYLKHKLSLHIMNYESRAWNPSAWKEVTAIAGLQLLRQYRKEHAKIYIYTW